MTDRIIWEYHDRPAGWLPAPDLGDDYELWIPDLAGGPIHAGDPYALVYGTGPTSSRPWLGGMYAALEQNVAVLRPWAQGQNLEYCGDDLERLALLESDMRRLMRVDEAGRRGLLDQLWSAWCDDMIVHCPVEDIERLIKITTPRWAQHTGRGMLNYNSVEAFESRVHTLRQIVRMDPACALRQQCEELLTSWTGTAVELLTTAAVAVGDDDRPEVDEMLGHLEGY